MNRKQRQKLRERVGGPSHEKMLERSRRYYWRHREKCLEKSKNWDEQHPEERRERGRRFREKKKLEKLTKEINNEL